MADGGFLVEEFLGAIASQLDRTQDALALKAVNRPLTYAIKDFDMDLKVFVQMDQEGKVRFRSPAADEPGASSVRIGFTTVTRPMIEENTFELALAKSPTLAEAGMPDAERQRLERLGVRTTAELQRLRSSAGESGISRLADVPIERLRAALSFGRPRVRRVRPAPAAPRPTATRQPSVQPPPAPATGPSPVTTAPPVTGAPGTRGPLRPRVPARPSTGPVGTPGLPPHGKPRGPGAPGTGSIAIPPSARRIELAGRNLLGPSGPPKLRLDGNQLAVSEADDRRVVVELPEDRPPAGTLEVDHGDGDVDTYELAPADPWAPKGG
ncbi:MAG TPA: hypothetical protein VGV57_06295 [Thermoleophilaceae bacterium]|nr:hypothetical protein [Thermoleophilaceae bacterium]